MPRYPKPPSAADYFNRIYELDEELDRLSGNKVEAKESLFKKEEKQLVILIIRIGHRKEIYWSLD